MQYCSTCLSSDRNCDKLSDRPEFWVILNLLDVGLSVATDYICWECACIFKRIARFRSQILQAQGLLRNCSKLLRISPGGTCTKKIQLETLSQLSSVTKNTFDNIYVEEKNKTEFKFVTPDDQSELNDSENFEVVFIDDWDKDSDVKNDETAIDIRNETDTEKSEIEDNNYVEEENRTEVKFVTPDDGSLINDREYFEVESIDDWDTLESDVQNLNVQNKTAGRIETDAEKSEIEEIKIVQKPPYDYKVLKDLRVSKQEEMYTITNMTMQAMFKARDIDRDNPRYKNCPYKCIKCITGFFEEDKYKKHLELHDPSLDANKKLRKCPICELRCRRGSSYDSHYDRHFRLYTCASCDYSDHRLAKMTQHHERNHNQNAVYECKICQEKFKLPRSLKYHYETSHREKPKCDVCGKVFSTKSNLKIHMLVHTGAPRAACPVCGREVRASCLRSHARTHAPRAPDAYCAECDISFATEAFYKQHLRLSKRHRHEDQLKHACAQCPARFVGKHALTLHVTAMHLKAHPFKCDICGKAFMRKCRIKAHIMEKHEGKTKPKDKMCGFCGKAFHSNALLKNHVRIHTGERPFACEHCPAVFTQKSTLRTHAKALHKHVNT